MQEFIQNIAVSVAGALNSNELVVFLMSMLPIVEVRGGIPMGLELGLTPAQSFGYAILSGMVVVPIILFLLKKVIHWMCKSKIFGKFGKALDGYFYEKAQKVEEGKIVQNRKSVILKYIALYVFVAAPLPLTGFWTGSAVAVFLNLNPFISFFIITIGNLTAGGLILAMSLLLGENAYIITVIFLIFVPIVFAILFYKLYKKRKQDKLNAKNIENVAKDDVVNEIESNEIASETAENINIADINDNDAESKSEKESEVESKIDTNIDTEIETDDKLDSVDNKSETNNDEKLYNADSKSDL